MPMLQLNISYRRPLGPSGRFLQLEGLREVLNVLAGVESGRKECDAVQWAYNDSVIPNSNLSYPGQAAGLLVGSSLSGSVGGTIGGTAVTVTASGGDTATQTALVAAIKANATVNQFVTATNRLASLTCVSVVAGTTVKVGQVVLTAIANGATPTAFGQFSVGASDTACALAMVNAINQHPVLSMKYRAVSIAGVVYVGLTDDRVVGKFDLVESASAATIAITQFAAGARAMVLANSPGVLGNFVTVVASGTGMTYSTNGTAGQLGNGSGGFTPTFTQLVQP